MKSMMSFLLFLFSVIFIIIGTLTLLTPYLKTMMEFIMNLPRFVLSILLILIGLLCLILNKYEYEQ